VIKTAAFAEDYQFERALTANSMARERSIMESRPAELQKVTVP
jgi:hypothetical protein